MINLNINKREKIYLYAGAFSLVIFLIIQTIVFPIIDKKENLKKKLVGKTEQLQQITAMAAEYNAVKNSTLHSKSTINNRKKGFTLFSFLDELAGTSGIKSNIVYMKPSTSVQKKGGYKVSTVEIKVKDISTKQLVSYLHGVETSENSIKVKRLSITKDKNGLDSVMEIETVEL